MAHGMADVSRVLSQLPSIDRNSSNYHLFQHWAEKEGILHFDSAVTTSVGAKNKGQWLGCFVAIVKRAPWERELFAWAFPNPKPHVYEFSLDVPIHNARSGQQTKIDILRWDGKNPVPVKPVLISKDHGIGDMWVLEAYEVDPSCKPPICHFHL